MANSLKPSSEGLTIIDRARKRRGWTKTCTACWWQEAHTSRATLRRFWRGERIQQDAFIAICKAVGVADWQAIADMTDVSNATLPDVPPPPLTPRADLPDAPDVEAFYGRDPELQQLEQWIVADQCKLVTLAGMGGIGKTSLALALIDRIQYGFEHLVWRSLQTAPTLSHLLSSLLDAVNQPFTADVTQDTNQLIYYLRQHRCLIILDSLETVFYNSRESEAYNLFILRLKTERHQSCLLITSRELLQVMEDWSESAQYILLQGLQPIDALYLLLHRGFTGKEKGLSSLIQLYRGNPLALKMITTLIQSVFGGDVSAFLNQNTLVIGDRLRTILMQQIAMLSPLERDIAYWLAIWQEPISLCRLQTQLLCSPEPRTVLEAIVGLERRSLLEKQFNSTEPSFTMHPLIMNVIVQEIVERASQEIIEAIQTNKIEVFQVIKTHPLQQPSTDDIAGDRILMQLRNKLRLLPNLSWIQSLQHLLATLKTQSPFTVGYSVYNLVTLSERV